MTIEPRTDIAVAVVEALRPMLSAAFADLLTIANMREAENGELRRSVDNWRRVATAKFEEIVEVAAERDRLEAALRAQGEELAQALAELRRPAGGAVVTIPRGVPDDDAAFLPGDVMIRPR
jgi:predicted ATPase